MAAVIKDKIGQQAPQEKWQRILEIVWGLLPFIFLSLIVVLSFLSIDTAVTLLLVFTIAWFIRMLGYAYRLLGSFTNYKFACMINWREKLDSLNSGKIQVQHPDIPIKQRLAESWYKRQLNKALGDNAIDPSKLYQAVILAVYNEPKEVIESSIKSVIASNYDPSKLMLIIAYEERGGTETERIIRTLANRYDGKLGLVRSVKHPSNLPGEVKAKAGNITYAAKWLKGYCSDKQIAPENVVVTVLDSDNKPHPNYLAELSWSYALAENRTHRSFQPLPLFTNNIWSASPPIRVIAADTSFWFMMDMLRPRRLRLFSAYAQSLKTLEDVDYWNVRSIVEDGHQFWRSYFAYHGDHKVIPIWLPVCQDAVAGDGLLDTLKSQFKQLLRWAQGTSDTPYMLRGVLKDKQISLASKLVHAYRQVDDYMAWATTPLALGVGAWLPWLLRNHVGGSSDLAFKLFHVVIIMQVLAFVDLLVAVSVSIGLLPKRPEKYTLKRSLAMILQWALEPFILIFFVSGPSLIAHIRLILGKQLKEFNATTKIHSS